MALVDAADDEHRHQHLLLADACRVAREQRFERERTIGSHDQIDPRARDVDPRQLIDQLVHLCQHDALTERRGFDDGRAVLRIGAGIKVTRPVTLPCTHQCHLGVSSTSMRAYSSM